MSLFITIEGGEGAGKSTQIAVVREWLEQHGHDVLVTREPGGTLIGERIRDVLLHRQHEELADRTELLLMFAARAQLLAEKVRPALKAGRTVLCDRFTDATYAYQGGGRRIPESDIALLQQVVHPDLQPDLTLLFDIDVTLGFKRIGRSGRGTDRIESESLAFFERVRAAYLDRARAEPGRFALIDASTDADSVGDAVRCVLQQRLGTS